MHVIAFPNRHYAPGADALALAHTVIDSLTGLVAAVTGFSRSPGFAASPEDRLR
jgi:hypothetical protein